MLNKDQVRGLRTPIYCYDQGLLCQTIEAALAARPNDNYKIHYAIKANYNPVLLHIISRYGLGADCTSMGEMEAAVNAGFKYENIVLAGVGKSDEEIAYAISNGIECLNVESIEELELIADIARDLGKEARVALRINPDIDAHTHTYITTGLEENKFGIDRRLVDTAVHICQACDQINLVGLHLHIGSQILNMEPYALLCERINSITDKMRERGIEFKFINVGGGLGVDYDDPDTNPIPDFKGFFDTIASNLKLTEGQQCYCELGRALVAQCGTLLSHVLYIKHGIGRQFMIIDAGMNNLIRPALYQAHHKIQNLSNTGGPTDVYDVVGPICESDDCFGRDERLPISKRGDLIAIRTAGAYGESMSSCYNSRPLATSAII